MLNKLPKRRVEEAIGSPQLQFFEEHFVPRLHGDASLVDQINYRIAPSIICRSEAELLAVSAPRFAVRATLPCGSFVNLRRLPFLCDAVPDWSPRRPGSTNSSISQDDEQLSNNHPSNVVRKNCAASGRAIADSVLVPPKHLTADYRVLTTNLAQAYGEDCTKEMRPGVPFIRHIKLGGGLCAQANCFMATALLNQHASGVFGISEITALATSATDLELVLSGLDPAAICAYFNHPRVGLHCRHQTVPLPNSFVPKKFKDIFPAEIQHSVVGVRLFEKVLRAYLLSGFPVIIPTDYKRLYQDTELSAGPRNVVPPRASEKKINNHAVIAIGCHRRNPSEFLINDPALLPFLQASSRELYASRPSTFDEVTKEIQIDNLTCLPVTPARVTLPLLETTERDGREPGLGLFQWIAMKGGAFQKNSNPTLQRVLSHPTNSNWDLGEFCLLNIQDGAIVSPVELTTILQCIVGELPSALIDELVCSLKVFAQQSVGSKWFWLQYRTLNIQGCPSSAAILWDAESPADLHRDPSAVVEIVNGRVQPAEVLSPPTTPVSITTAHRVPSPRAALRERPLTAEQTYLQPAVISSICTAEKTRLVDQLIKHGPLSVEWYTVMQQELGSGPFKKLLAKAERSASLTLHTAVEFMSHHVNDFDAIKHVAQNAASVARQTRDVHPTTEIRALATFVPTISFPPDSEGARVARNALLFVSQVAHKLRGDFSQRVEVIEMVAGSRALGIFPAKSTIEGPDIDTDTYAANLLGCDESMQNVVDNLKIIFQELKRKHLFTDKLTWAVELEPGPLFVLNDFDSLRRLCSLIDNSAELSGSVGINVDIAHYRMAFLASHGDAQAGLHVLRNAPAVFSRIAHSHIAGHHPCAHFGDLSLSYHQNVESDFLPWLELLSERASLGSKPIPFSNLVSIELEATLAESALKDSVGLLKEMLRKLHKQA